MSCKTPVDFGKGMGPALLQVWLQEFSWTEASQAEQTARRNAHAQGPREAALLAAEPMFCFETALKLHGELGLALRA